jgi:molecular chaperone DnaK
MVKTYFGKEPHKGVNPDEVVAIGAAVQAGVLGGEVKDILLLDVTPLSLGIETLGGVFTRLITRNTTIPSRKAEVFSTAADGQTSVEVHVLQGEREMARDNKTLGRFHLDGIPAAPRGVPQIEVAFDIDANGIVHVAAKDLGTGKEQKITITASSGLSKDEVDRMVKEADAHAAEDRKRREGVEARNRADQLVYQAEKTLQENAAKLPEPDQAAVRDAVAAVKAALEQGDAEAITRATAELEKASHRMAEAIYRSAGAAPEGAPDAAGNPGAAPGTGGDVIDAEVVDDRKQS